MSSPKTDYVQISEIIYVKNSLLGSIPLNTFPKHGQTECPWKGRQPMVLIRLWWWMYPFLPGLPPIVKTLSFNCLSDLQTHQPNSSRQCPKGIANATCPKLDSATSLSPNLLLYLWHQLIMVKSSSSGSYFKSHLELQSLNTAEVLSRACFKIILCVWVWVWVCVWVCVGRGIQWEGGSRGIDDTMFSHTLTIT